MSNKKTNEQKKNEERERERETKRKEKKKKNVVSCKQKVLPSNYLALESFNRLSYKNFAGKKNLVSQQSQVCRISFWLVISFFVKTNSTPASQNI